MMPKKIANAIPFRIIFSLMKIKLLLDVHSHKDSHDASISGSVGPQHVADPLEIDGVCPTGMLRFSGATAVFAMKIFLLSP